MPIIPDFQPAGGNYQPSAPSVGAATIPGRAIAGIGNSIQKVGDALGAEQLRMQSEADQAAKNKARLEWQKAKQNHEVYRAENPDESTWESDAKQQAEKARNAVKSLPMSPKAKQDLDLEMEGWDQSMTSGTRADVANTRRSKARTDSTKLKEAFATTGDWDSYHRQNDEDHASGLLSDGEHKADQLEGQHRQNEQKKDDAFKSDIAEIDGDVFSVGEKYAPGAKPRDSEEPTEFYRKQEHYQRKLAQERNRIADTLRDGLSGERPKITRPEQLNEWRDELGDAAIDEFQAGMSKRATFLHRAQMALPSQQEAAIGEAANLIDTFDPADIRTRVAVENRLDDINPGPTKSHLSEQLRKKIAGEPPDTSALTNVKALVAQAFTMNLLGPTSVSAPQTTADVVSDDFLQDGRKLQDLGFEESAASSIMDPLLTDEKRIDKFRELYPSRNKSKASADTYTGNAAAALFERRRTVDRDPKEIAKESAAMFGTMRRRGQLERQLIEWSLRHPGDDPTPEFFRLVGDSASQQLLDSVGEPYGNPIFGETFAPTPSSGNPLRPDLPSGRGSSNSSLLPPK